MLPPTLGEDLGSRETEELWVGVWWKWWRSLQPEERSALENGELSHPETVDWSGMAQMYGKNGMLLVMATLGWWGKVAQRREEAEVKEWLVAVGDVTWVLEQVLESGEIDKSVHQSSVMKGDSPEHSGTTSRAISENEKGQVALLKSEWKI